MSCDNRAKETAVCLQQQSRVPYAGVAGADKCCYPLCNAPLRKNSQPVQCVNGHRQDNIGTQVKQEYVEAKNDVARIGDYEEKFKDALRKQEVVLETADDPESVRARIRETEKILQGFNAAFERMEATERELLVWAQMRLESDTKATRHAKLGEMFERGVGNWTPEEREDALGIALTLKSGPSGQGRPSRKKGRTPLLEASFRLSDYRVDGRSTIRTVRFKDGRLDAQSRRSLADSVARQWGSINSRKTVFSAGKDGMQATWYNCSGHGGYVVVTDRPLEWGGAPAKASTDWSHHMEPYQFYVYTFEENCDWAIFERYMFDELAERRWQGWDGRLRQLWTGRTISDIGPVVAAGDPPAEAFHAFRARLWKETISSLQRWHQDHIPVKFPAGDVDISPGAQSVLEQEMVEESRSREETSWRSEGPATIEDIREYVLQQHQAGAWGAVSLAQMEQNERALQEGGEVRSVVGMRHVDAEIAVVTSPDRSETTLELLPGKSSLRSIEQGTASRRKAETLGDRSLRVAQYAEAEAHLRDALSQNPDFHDRHWAREELAAALSRQDDPVKLDEAREIYTEMWERAKPYADQGTYSAAYDYAMALGQIALKQEDRPKARECGEYAQELISKHSWMAWAYGSNVRDLLQEAA